MSNLKIYCITCFGCATVEKEKASIFGRGLFGGAWVRHNDKCGMSVIIPSHENVRNTFVGFNV